MIHSKGVIVSVIKNGKFFLQINMSSVIFSNLSSNSESFIMELAQIITWFYEFLDQIDKRINHNIRNQMILFEAYNAYQEMFSQDGDMQLRDNCESFLDKCENLKRDIHKTKQNCAQLQELRKETFSIYLKNTLTLLDLLDADEFATMIEKFMELKACSQSGSDTSFTSSKDDLNDEFNPGPLRKRRNSS